MTRTNRSHFLRAAVGAAFLAGAAGASAQSVILYGLLDASGSYTKPVGGDGRYQLDSGNLQRSFLGLRGSEDLGGGLRAVFKLESYVRVDTGASGRTDSDTFWSRESSLGLSGSFGTTLLGRNVTPLYGATIAFNPFGEGFGLSPATRQYFGTSGAVLGDTRWSNSIAYTNNASDEPLRVNLAANLPEEPAGTPNQSKNFGASVAYITGPFAATLAAERIGNGSLGTLPTGFRHQFAIQGGATYDFKLLRVYGQLGHVSTAAAPNYNSTIYQLGAAVPIGTSLILVSYGRSHTKSPALGTTDQTGTIGYDYFLSKNTDLYVAAMVEKYTNTSSGHTFAGGMRLRF